ncbi:serine/threonine-protein kinase pim-3-like [Oratosquilla oratoria]|uniref:serine/threonine-protein kinase pim-3-like n=1 Tax=Oratosquilla oratoria TaxID=337810 RepID=UPI003F75DD11
MLSLPKESPLSPELWILRETCRASKRYRLGHTLGKGGLSSAFAARRIKDGTLVAIKGIALTAVDSWERRRGKTVPVERLQHVPGVIGLHNCITIEGSFFMVMEFTPGHRVALDLHEERQRPWTRSRDSSAKSSRQSKAVSHKDIKPENVLLFRAESTVELDIRLIDFGCGEMAERHWGTFTGGTPLC